MKALVTGGAGFIGSHLADRLISEGYEVAIIDDLSLGFVHNVPERAHFVRQSILAPFDILDKELGDGRFDVMFHVAALPRVQYSIQHPEQTHAVNATGTMHMLEYCRARRIPRFVFSSSSSVYGDQKEMPLRESMIPSPMSPYAAQKAMGENLCTGWRHSFGLETIALRYFNVFGPRQSAEGGYACLIPKVIRALLEGRPPELWGDGSHTRDFTYVDDVVFANLAAARTTNGSAFGHAYNVGVGKGYSVLHVIDSIQKALGTRIELDHKPPVIEPEHTKADIQGAHVALGWSPRVSFEEGLARTVVWFKETHQMV